MNGFAAPSTIIGTVWSESVGVESIDQSARQQLPAPLGNCAVPNFVLVFGDLYSKHEPRGEMRMVDRIKNKSKFK